MILLQILLPLLILIPFISGIIAFLWKSNSVKSWALISSLATLALAVFSAQVATVNALSYDHSWISSLGARLNLRGEGMSMMLVLLTAIVFPIVFIAQWNKPVEGMNRFMGLMLMTQAGLMGVFLAHDLLLFYFFWELALIPVYFLCSTWGGGKRIPVTFKFFVYTFLGSLIMLSGIIYIYTQTQTNSNAFTWETVKQTCASLPAMQQQILFGLFFIAFGIKMPIFPFHTWQPDTYEQSATPVTIILSALMVKMGLFATVNWLVDIFPAGTAYWSNTVMILAVIGIVYASLLAWVQTDIKRLIAYSSIAHIGLMALGIFANTDIAHNGLMVQMFNHGINITGMWLIVSMIEQRYGTRNLKELGGMAGTAPTMTIALVIIAFANIALPLTNGFIGEFMLFHGIFQSANPNHITFMVLAGLGVILGAVYTLNMVQKVAYGESKTSEVIKDVSKNEMIGIVIIIAIILVLGVYPNLLMGILK